MFLRKILPRLKQAYRIPGSDRVEAVFSSFSPAGKLAVYALLGIFFLSTLGILFQVNNAAIVDVPSRGGSLSEGVVGSPRFVNPLLAITDADRDLTMLVYSGLLRATPQGTLIPDLAESYDISNDGLTYTFRLRQNAAFQDGAPVSADDVFFTIEKAQDPRLKSPRRANWEGVNVQKIDERTVVFTLKQQYSPFLENTTIGILPKHIWETVTDDQFPFSKTNIEPVGSGPYKVKSVSRNASGIPTAYTLVPFSAYALGKAYISRITLHFYQSEQDALDAYRQGDVESIGGVSPSDLKRLKLSDTAVERATLPRVFGLFFNQNQQPLFANREVRLALAESLDKADIVNSIFHGFASVIDGPIPPGIIPLEKGTTGQKADIAAAQNILTKNGWKQNSDGIFEKKEKKKTQTLQFSISTANVPELRSTAELMKETWTKLGASVDLKIFEPGDLNQNVIRARKYDALLFGEVVGRELDLYAFWHSSQRNDPGLNIAMYVNSKADKLLEQMRSLSDPKKRVDLYRQFQNIVSSDVPAIFAYSPDFMYLVPHKLKGLSLGTITTPSERFLGAYRWYIETDRVWNIFLKK